MVGVCVHAQGFVHDGASTFVFERKLFFLYLLQVAFAVACGTCGATWVARAHYPTTTVKERLQRASDL